MAPPENKPSKPVQRRKKVTTKSKAMKAKRARPPRRTGDAPALVSPAAAGPSGALLEGHVGAQYLLPLLSGGEARGLPGVLVTRVAFQRAGFNHPMDDVVVTGHDHQGHPATLELQAKRTITFTASDKTFADVVALACRAAIKPEFATMHYELAVAIARTSTRIEQHIQEVLKWARDYQNAEGFFLRLNQPGAAHQAKREFVAAFRGHMRTASAAHDDATVWQLLSRFQVLAFDFEQPGSLCAQWARERCSLQLAAQDMARSGELWDSLKQVALQVDASGGDLDATALRERLTGERGYRLAGNRRLHEARKRLAESAESTLATIGTRVHGVAIDRGRRVAEALSALAQGGFLEIRGAGGVGKSGILKELAQRIGVESRVIVVAPHRVPGGGWTAMAVQLGCEVSAREFLTDLAGDGGATLFVDGIDRFDDPRQRATVTDLILAAALVRGFSVVVTARLDFDRDARAWLPAQALQDLGEAPSMVIDELGDDEVALLRDADPALAELLRPGHPAKHLVRNLYRLDRLARVVTAEAGSQFSEAQMAWQWWMTGDAAGTAGRLDRRRLLRSLAVHSLGSSAPMDSSAAPAEAVTALTESGSFRALSSVWVEPMHDVLRDWAIGCLLYEEPENFAAIALEGPAPMRLVRGVEVAARLHAELGNDSSLWRALLDRVGVPGSHASWRRAVLLALVRSEAGIAVLQRAAPELYKNQAALLRELIRTVLAVEVVPATTAWSPAVLSAAGIDPGIFPPNLNVPRGSAWQELILWLLSLGHTVPAAAIPEIVDLYTTFSIGTFGLTDITPLTTRCLYRWLRLMEPRDTRPAPHEGSDFWKDLQREQVQSLKLDLRSGFLWFCRLTPELAAEYLVAVAQSEHNDELVRSILKIPGTLAQAAPAELAELTAQALIEKRRPRNRSYGHERDEPFTLLDHEFLPASPSQGPFFDLLTNAPKVGLALVRKLVDHAVAHASRRCTAGSNVIELALPEGARSFPWTDTYFWSRSSHYDCVTSALMALEAWAHRRIDVGEDFELVLAEVLGPVGSPAAFLLVAVDLIISHWPKSANVAAEFLGCPELLCLDHTRQVHDRFESPDFFGVGALRSEPRGNVSAIELKRRGSRRTTLDDLIGKYALMVSAAQGAKLVALLQQAAARLGPPDSESTLGDPQFMVLSALNLAEPANWHEVAVTLKDGSTVTARQYVSPAAEQTHLQALRDAAAEGDSDFAMQSSLSLAVDDPSYLSSEARSAAFAWARRVASQADPLPDDSDDDGTQRMRNEAVLTAAMIVMRDGDDAQRAEHEGWARVQLEAVLQSLDADPVHQMRTGLRYNPPAIAYVGMIHALRHRNTTENVRALLEIAVRDNPAVAHGFGATISVLERIDARLPRALLRCALTPCILPNREWDLPAEERAARAEQRLQRAKAAVDAEIAWVTESGQEPGWPYFPQEQVRRRRRLWVPGGIRSNNEGNVVEPHPSKEYVNHQAAALWLRQARSLRDDASLPWLSELVRAYMPWTIRANGAELDDGDETDHPPTEWNDAFFALASRCMVGLSFDEAAALVVTPITTLPDRHFFDVLAVFQRGVDGVYFGGGNIAAPVAVDIRATLAKRMMGSRGWKRLCGSKEMSIEMHIGPAIAVLFFNDHHYVQSTKCYVLAKGVEGVDPFLTVLGSLVKSAPSPFVALVLLNLLEVAPRPEHLDILVATGKAWLDTYPDFRPFWVDQGFGRRWSVIVEKICSQVPTAVDAQLPIRSALDGIVAALIGLGIPDASRLENALTET